MAGENILVVDDEVIIGTAFKRELEVQGYHVDVVLSGEEAVEIVKTKKYDLIFIDLVLPEIDGIEVLKRVKSFDPGITAVFMTGCLDRDILMKEMEFVGAGGKVYFLYKPFLDNELYEIIQKALSQKA